MILEYSYYEFKNFEPRLSFINYQKKHKNLKKKIVFNVCLLMTMNRILQGVEYLHFNSLVHHDLKLSNINRRIFLLVLKYSHVWCVWRWAVTNENDADDAACNAENGTAGDRRFCWQINFFNAGWDTAEEEFAT